MASVPSDQILHASHPRLHKVIETLGIYIELKRVAKRLVVILGNCMKKPAQINPAVFGLTVILSHKATTEKNCISRYITQIIAPFLRPLLVTPRFQRAEMSQLGKFIGMLRIRFAGRAVANTCRDFNCFGIWRKVLLGTIFRYGLGMPIISLGHRVSSLVIKY